MQTAGKITLLYSQSLHFYIGDSKSDDSELSCNK